VKRPARLCLLILLAWTIPCRADSPSYDPHDGKPIQRTVAPDTSTPIKVPAPTDLDFGRVAIALMAVIGLILLLRGMGKKFFPSMIVGGDQPVRVLARCPLSPRQQVVLLQIGRRIVVAADSNSQLSCLTQITDADEVAALLGEVRREKPRPAGSAFSAWFAKAAQSFGRTSEPEIPEDDLAEPTAENTDLEVEKPTSPQEQPALADLSERVRQWSRRLGKPTDQSDATDERQSA
jgi:flagellar biogenesis protein FliO